MTGKSPVNNQTVFECKVSIHVRHGGLQSEQYFSTKLIHSADSSSCRDLTIKQLAMHPL